LFIGGAPVGPPASPPRGAPSTARIARPPIVWLEATQFTRGSTEEDIEYAVELCVRTTPRVHAQLLCHPETFAHETPPQRVHLDAYGIDRTEVTVEAYRRCVIAGVCTPSRIAADDERLGLPDHPVTGVDFGQASRYCEFVGGRLPTEAEWEHAARGHDGRRFPWGNFYNDRLANHSQLGLESAVDGYRYAAPVTAHVDGRSAYGLLGMAGNAMEWTADLYASDAYTTSSAVNPRGARAGGQRVVRGGSWRLYAFALRATHRFQAGAGQAAPDLGFRCAYDPP
jgi:formylglycine-generating enzyme required for sulfatase activity